MAKKKEGTTTPKRRGRPPKKQTYVALVIDRSGSMGNVRASAISGINEQINAIKASAKLGGATFVTYVQFDNHIDVIYDKKAASELQEVTEKDYEPRGMTAMYDGVYTAIQRLKAGVKETADTSYLVVVISDGAENSSREITSAGLAEEIKKLQATGKWTFTYMLSNQDLTKVQQAFGLSAGNMASYTSTATGTVNAFSNMSTATNSYFNQRSMGVLSTSKFYDSGVTGVTVPVKGVSATAVDANSTDKTNDTK